MPENTHRNRMIHFYVLIVFIGRWLPSDPMSVKIKRRVNLQKVAALFLSMAISALTT
jgi:hypothetical protein